MNKIGRLCVITDTVIQKKYSHEEIAKMAIKGGADIIQFRDKTMPTSELAETALRIAKLCKKQGILFIVNDRADIALVSNADGVHLGKEDISVKDARKLLGKNKIVGGTAHSLSDAIKAEKAGVDYIGYGHIYHTFSKLKKTKPKGIKELQYVCKKIKIPVIAIGGISVLNASEVMNAKAHGIAVIGSVLQNSDPVKAVAKLRKIVYG